jgi:hypothetical protein
VKSKTTRQDNLTFDKKPRVLAFHKEVTMNIQLAARKAFVVFLALALCLSWLPVSIQTANALSPNIAAGELFAGRGIFAPQSDPSGIGAATPPVVDPGDTSLLTVAVTPGTDPASTNLAVTADLTGIGGAGTQAFFDDGSSGDAAAGDNTFSFLATIPMTTTPGTRTLPATIVDGQSRTGSASIQLYIRPPLVPIHDIQGAGHSSPKLGQLVTTQGVVIAVRSNSFYMQDPAPDASDDTSEAIYVFTSSAPTVSIGDLVEVAGTVKEFRPGGAASTNLATTELDNPGRLVTVLSSGEPLPAATVVGAGGRIPPAAIIEDDAGGDVETGGVFDPATDGIDFYESLESMLLQVNNPVAVGPTNAFGELPVLPDDGAAAGLRTPRGGIVIRPADFNPERIILDDVLNPVPPANVGDHLATPVTGVLDYSFGNFKLLVTAAPVLVPGGLAQEAAAPVPAYQLAVATFNVENLSPSSPPAKFAELAGLVVTHLKTPDILAVEEIQDNTGPTDDGVVAADQTYQALIAAIQAAGGPLYDYRQIDPQDKQDGGAPGGNIRVGFLFRTDRGLEFIDRPGGDALTPVGVTSGSGGAELTVSPGRIDPTNPAFVDSRKPLAGEFTFKGDKVFVVANHFNSKSGDQPLFGHFQPPLLSSEAQRLQQAQAVNDFVDSLLAVDPQANVVVAGDLNDFQFSAVLAALKGGVLENLVDTLPEAERYTYVFDGNSQTLDHILLGSSTFSRPYTYDILHVNAEFAAQASDHDPQIAGLCVDATPPTVTGTVSPNVLWPPNHKYVTVKSTVTVEDNADAAPTLTLVSVTSDEPDDATGDGHTINDVVIVDDYTFKLRAERSGNGDGRIYLVTYQATDACGNSTLSSTPVYVPHDKADLKDLMEQFPPEASPRPLLAYTLYRRYSSMLWLFMPVVRR